MKEFPFKRKIDWSGVLIIGLPIIIFFLIMIVVLIPINYSYNIASLQDDSQISGSFFLGSGSIKEDPVFVTYQVINYHSYRLITIPADHSIIIEDTNTPYVDVSGCAVMPIYEIHVPAGTIIQQYNLDGKL